ncbi:hypothetical protein TARUN_7410 [Trichoderma arundinaceum]|uniref:BZIP domain-containing protein n=1 Tax=Trichoderma arundinaceum TaxID=490622 RepID=A0A395NG10_TRIAR|nr:hypothetical protein TARUN_7410 [Trichoderma arundinaceum]
MQVAVGEANVGKPPAQKKPRRRPNKPISAERRMQNCKAQRAYRQRKRERLIELEAKVASLEPRGESEPGYPSGNNPVTSLTTPIPDPYHLPRDSTPAAVDPSQLDNSWTYDPSLWLKEPPSTSLEAQVMKSPLVDSNIVESLLIEGSSMESFSSFLHSSDTHNTPNSQTENASIPSTAKSSHSTVPVPPSSSSLLSAKTTATMYSAPISHARKDIHIYRPSSKPLLSKPQLIRKWFLSLPQITRRYLAQLAKDGDFGFVDLISSLLLAETGVNNNTSENLESGDQGNTGSLLAGIGFTMSPAASYSPYRNTLRIARLSYFTALFANFGSLGFDFGLFLDERSLSPFCSGSPTKDVGTSAVITDGNIPSSLRPLPSQFTILHHPYIDALPFPTLRRRALAALAADPPLLDEDDLCLDLMLHDGLVCWGSANLNGTDHGTPWDSHSWEAKEWFLRKWKWLIGGQDGELWHSSRWWAAQRGEYISMQD